MRIVNYHPRASVGDGGITNSVRRLSVAMARAGADPVIVYDGDGDPHEEDGVTWRPVPHRGRGALRVPVRASSAIRDTEVLILNSAWTAANVRLGRAARRSATPYVLAPRGAYDPLIVERRRLLKRVWWTVFERRLVRDAAAIHVFFDEQRHDLDRLGIAGRILVAPNGVDVPADRRWDGGSGGYVLYLGRFDPEHKGLDLLLEGLAQLPSTVRPVLRLHGPDWRGGKPRVAAMVDRLGLAAHVTVAEALYGDDKWSALERAQGLVYPSRWEGFGNSLAEAAALGLPTLATSYPLARSLGERGGCIVVAADPRELAEGLRQLVAGDAAAVGARGRELAREELGWDAVALRWLEQLAAVPRPEGRPPLS